MSIAHFTDRRLVVEPSSTSTIYIIYSGRSAAAEEAWLRDTATFPDDGGHTKKNGFRFYFTRVPFLGSPTIS